MTPLALRPCVVLQSAIKFINLTVPSSAGRIGMNIRFLQRMGAPLPEAVAAGAIDDASQTLVQIGLFLLVIPTALLIWTWRRHGRAIVLPFDHGDAPTGAWTRFFLHLVESLPALGGSVVAVR